MRGGRVDGGGSRIFTNIGRGNDGGLELYMLSIILLIINHRILNLIFQNYLIYCLIFKTTN